MRRTLAVLLTVLLFVLELPARTNRDWTKVETLKPGSAVLVMLWSGEDLTGRFSSATNSALVLTLTGTIGSPRTIDRANIRRVVRIRRPSLPDPGKWMIVGAVAGGAIGATSGAIRDANHHQNNGGWFIGGLERDSAS
jgi:hypothetical protein